MRSARSQPQNDDLLLPDARTVRVLVMGDQGVGKSELLAYICGQATDSEERSSGLQVWVKLSRGGDGRKEVFEFIELAGESKYHKSTRWPMFNRADALILVYDLTDDTSACSLRQWYESFEEYRLAQNPTGPSIQMVDSTPVNTDSCYPSPYRRSYMPALRPRGQFAAHDRTPVITTPVLVIGTRKDKARPPANPASYWRKVSRFLLSTQRMLAAVLQRVLFLPMPSFMLAGGGKEGAMEFFRARTNTSFVEWSARNPSTDIEGVTAFLDSVVDAMYPTC
ncbi:Ras-related protein RABG2 [Diplonema papillatum]|nr:Ras-related protein RABG2 [Diplonema papillatum]